MWFLQVIYVWLKMNYKEQAQNYTQFMLDMTPEKLNPGPEYKVQSGKVSGGGWGEVLRPQLTELVSKSKIPNCPCSCF